MSREENRTISRKGISVRRLREPELTGKGKDRNVAMEVKGLILDRMDPLEAGGIHLRRQFGAEAKSRCWKYLPVDR